VVPQLQTTRDTCHPARHNIQNYPGPATPDSSNQAYNMHTLTPLGALLVYWFTRLEAAQEAVYLQRCKGFARGMCKLMSCSKFFGTNTTSIFSCSISPHRVPPSCPLTPCYSYHVYIMSSTPMKLLMIILLTVSLQNLTEIIFVATHQRYTHSAACLSPPCYPIQRFLPDMLVTLVFLCVLWPRLQSNPGAPLIKSYKYSILICFVYYHVKKTSSIIKID
jgi:hypothetical protein